MDGIGCAPMSMDAAQRTDGAEVRPPEGVRCDFCGEHVSRVRRIALDRDYERLRTPHRVQYACDPCSARKDAERRARSGS